MKPHPTLASVRKGSILARWGRSQPLPGFPWRGHFGAREEIDDYFAGEWIVCLMCGRQVRALGRHLVRDCPQGVGVDEYRARFGLPWTVGLVGDVTRAKMRDAMMRRRAAGYRTESEKAHLMPGGGTRQRQRRSQPFFKAELAARAARAASVANAAVHEVLCELCGATSLRPGTNARYCVGCREVHARGAARSWYWAHREEILSRKRAWAKAHRAAETARHARYRQARRQRTVREAGGRGR